MHRGSRTQGRSKNSSLLIMDFPIMEKSDIIEINKWGGGIVSMTPYTQTQIRRVRQEWKGESLKDYWDCIFNTLIYPEDGGKGHRPDLIVDDGFTLLFSPMRVRRQSNCSSSMVLSLTPAPRTIPSSRFSKSSSRVIQRVERRISGIFQYVYGSF